MEELSNMLTRWATSLPISSAIRFILIILLGLLLARVLPAKVTIPLVPEPQTLLVRKLFRYAILIGTLALSLRQLGFDLSVVLGAAGILTVAIGFAAQTSASNLISGVFLLWEHPFSEGDVIEVNAVRGTVASIDTLSVKLRTFDNLLVRIPNETMLKSNVTNVTRYPLRRVDLRLRIAYTDEPDRIEKVLLRVAQENSTCLTNPPPVVLFVGFSEFSIELQFSVWGLTSDYVTLKKEIAFSVLRTFRQEGINIPFASRALYFTPDGAPPTRSNEPPTQIG